MNKLTNDFDAVKKYDNENVIHPWEGMATLGNNERTFAEKAEGIYVSDEEGNRYIDGPGGMWCVQIGYGRADMADAIADQIKSMTYYSPWNMGSSPTAILAKKIAERTPGDLNRVFFTTGGSTAVDTALRFIHFRNNVLGKPDKKIVISREDAYHGSSYLSSSYCGKGRDKTSMDTETRLTHFLPHVNPYRRPEGMSVEEFCDAKIADLENAILELGTDKVAAFIAEPILASGGVIVPPPGYQKRCLEVCRKHDVLYISDEVVTAFGRLGHWFASEEVFDIVPDIITSAKGLTSGYQPLGACIISDSLFDAMTGDNAKDAYFSNGYTYTGHPASCAAALKNIEIFEEEGILEHVQELTPYFQESIRALADIPIVGEVRGVGLMGCIECASVKDNNGTIEQDTAIGYRIDVHCQELGLLVRPIINMCVFSPPLIITKDQIDDMVKIMREALIRTMEDLIKEGLWSDDGKDYRLA